MIDLQNENKKDIPTAQNHEETKVSEEVTPPTSGEETPESLSAQGSKEVTSPAAGEEPPESLSAQDELTRLQAEVERLSAEVEKWRDQALRIAADFENYRRRIQRDLPQQITAAQGEILRALLPIIDSIERGLLSAQQAPDIEKLKEGLQLTLHQLHKTLEKLDIQVIRPAIGDLPDPEKHEVLSTQPAPAATEVNTILEVVEPGYLYKGLLLRPARIIVSA
ncbi:MAG: nucleotide exchange factor GrpE [Bacteroidota bacterium]|nr:nucleotide exchange factor GrpE [Bacteroidota bacterium]